MTRLDRGVYIEGDVLHFDLSIVSRRSAIAWLLRWLESTRVPWMELFD